MNTKQPSTQENVPVAGIKDGVIILKNGQYRIILSVSAINFDLKSEQEQNSIIFNYQSFLNSLHFPIEILISSKKLDLTPYLNRIKKLSALQKNELLKVQTEDYVDFVSQLINLANIMKKSFFVSVGYQPLNMNGGSFIDKIFKKNEPTAQLRVSEEEFNRYTGELRQRAGTAAQGLGSIGLHCKQLTTEEIIELLYSTYNPEVAGKERLSGESDNFSSTIVSKAQGQPIKETATDQVQTGEITIDNTEIVNAQHKKMEEERKQEIEKQAERDMKAPPTATPANTAGKETPVTEKTKVDLGTIQSIPAAPKAGENVTAQNTEAPVVEDVKDQPQVPLATPAQASATAVQDFDKSIKDPANNKDFGW